MSLDTTFARDGGATSSRPLRPTVGKARATNARRRLGLSSRRVRYRMNFGNRRFQRSPRGSESSRSDGRPRSRRSALAATGRAKTPATSGSNPRDTGSRLAMMIGAAGVPPRSGVFVLRRGGLRWAASETLTAESSGSVMRMASSAGPASITMTGRMRRAGGGGSEAVVLAGVASFLAWNIAEAVA